ncbi:MAG: FG-GAP-like repeat-containing protein [Hyphomonadaceae bacterium]
MTPADVDGDGDLDLYFAHVGWQGRAPQDLYINDGNGRFSDETAARVPAEATSRSTPNSRTLMAMAILISSRAAGARSVCTRTTEEGASPK